MKRVCESMHFNEELPSDVWSYIINIYHHLRFIEQWQELKLACLCYNKYLLPADKVEIPLYTDTIKINTCSIFYRIRHICWNEDGHIIGVLTDSFDFNPLQPSQARHRDEPIRVINGSYCPETPTRFYYFLKDTMVKKNYDNNTRQSKIVTISLSVFPQHLFL